MKRILTLLILCLLAVTAGAQNNLTAQQKQRIERCHKVVLDCMNELKKETKGYEITLISKPQLFGINNCEMYIKNGDKDFSLRNITRQEDGDMFQALTDEKCAAYYGRPYEGDVMVSAHHFILVDIDGTTLNKYFIVSATFYDDRNNKIAEYVPGLDNATDNILHRFMKRVFLQAEDDDSSSAGTSSSATTSSSAGTSSAAESSAEPASFYKSGGELTAVDMMLHPFGIFHSCDSKLTSNQMLEKVRRFGWNATQNTEGGISILEPFSRRIHIPFTYKGHEIYSMYASFYNNNLWQYSFSISLTSKEQAISMVKEMERELTAHGMNFKKENPKYYFYDSKASWRTLKLEVHITKCDRKTYVLTLNVENTLATWS